MGFVVLEFFHFKTHTLNKLSNRFVLTNVMSLKSIQDIDNKNMFYISCRIYNQDSRTTKRFKTENTEIT